MVFGEQGQVLRAAVLGSPIRHSLSPVLHRAGYAACGLTQWSYDAHEVTQGELAGFVGPLDESWRGLSLTMPLKEAAFEVATTVTPIATAAGAINTLARRDDGGWDATNTDVAGIVEAVRPHLAGRDLTSAHVVGAGATARSALLALHDLGVGHLGVRARRPEALEDMGRWLTTAGIGDFDLGPIEAVGHDAPIVISTVPPAASETVAASLPEANGVLPDVVYADWPTPLARVAIYRGWTVVSGLDMLVHQAAAQFELFTGVAAPVDEMLRAGRAVLERR